MSEFEQAFRSFQLLTRNRYGKKAIHSNSNYQPLVLRFCNLLVVRVNRW